MKKILILIALATALNTYTNKSYAWGKTGHELVAYVAYHYLDDSTRKMVLEYLDGINFGDAANWMDEMRSNSYYGFQRPWHYIDFEKDEKFHPSAERNCLTVLHSAITELKQYKTLKKKDIKRDLLLIFHLVGDLHQPLHCGYGSDRGGNDVTVTSNVVSGNLHSVWDTQILEYKKLNLDSCLAAYNTLDSATVADINKINELKWMYESRSYLDTVYNFKDNYLDQRYVDSNADIIKKQILLGGLRLAAVLKSVFNPEAKLKN